MAMAGVKHSGRQREKNAILMERLVNIEKRLSKLESKKVNKPTTIQEATNE